MATLSVPKFDDLNGADRVLLALEGLQERQMITLEDAAVVSWPLGSKKPKTRLQNTTALFTNVVEGRFCERRLSPFSESSQSPEIK